MLTYIDFNFLHKSLIWIVCCCKTDDINKKNTENIFYLDLKNPTVFSSSFSTPDLFFFLQHHEMAVAEEEEKFEIKFQFVVLVVKDPNMFSVLKL